MFKTLLLIAVIALSTVYSQTLCEKYGNITKASNQSMLVTGVVVNAVGHILQDGGLRKFFDGSYTVKTNFTGDGNAFGALAGKLVSFFGTALGCTDGTIPMYTGNLTLAHIGMNISYSEYNRFNYLVVKTLSDAGFTEEDSNAVAQAINIRGLCTSSDMTCDTFCNRYSIPWYLNNTGLVERVVYQTVAAALGSSLLKPFFDGTTPTGSTNYTDSANALKFLNLFNHLVQFFGGALGCTDGSVPMYSGNPDMKAVHANIPINKAAFEAFNGAVVAQMQALGVAQPDLDAVATLLASLKGDICNQADCGNMMTSNMGTSNMMTSNMGSSNMMTSNMGSTNMMTSNGATSNKASSTSKSVSTTGDAYTLIFSVVALLVTLLI